MNPVEAQRTAALQKSRQVREAKAAVCRALKRGNMTLEEAMRHPCVWKMQIGQLVCQLPMVGPHKMKFILQLAHVDQVRLVGALNPRARAGLVAAEGRAEELAHERRCQRERRYKREHREAAA